MAGLGRGGLAEVVAPGGERGLCRRVPASCKTEALRKRRRVGSMAFIRKKRQEQQLYSKERWVRRPAWRGRGFAPVPGSGAFSARSSSSAGVQAEHLLLKCAPTQGKASKHAGICGPRRVRGTGQTRPFSTLPGPRFWFAGQTGEEDQRAGEEG